MVCLMEWDIKMRLIVTGAAGFIGSHVSKRLVSQGHEVLGFDNHNDYYDPSIKEARVEWISEGLSKRLYRHFIGDIADKEQLAEAYENIRPDVVINLAAQAGVRYSIENPEAYIRSNVVGFGNILELSREHKIGHLIYASSSSVYGGNAKLPFSEKDPVDHPLSIYAATKRSNELMAHAYSNLFTLPTTGLRFFTVYGPWGRPDMALFKFAKNIIEGKEVVLYNNGNMMRDFTYIDDIVESIVGLCGKPPRGDDVKESGYGPYNSWCPFRVFNIGNGSPVELKEYVIELEKALRIKGKIVFDSLQPGDVIATNASSEMLEEWIGFRPRTSIRKGISEFVKWYRDYHKV